MYQGCHGGHESFRFKSECGSSTCLDSSRTLMVSKRIDIGQTSENWRMVVPEIDSPLRMFLISVEVEKFPRASSSSAGRPRQVVADRARAGEKFLMAHFPASPSMSRLAGSSGTQKVCETTKSMNRTGGRRWSKSRGRHSRTCPRAMTSREVSLCAEDVRQSQVSGWPSAGPDQDRPQVFPFSTGPSEVSTASSLAGVLRFKSSRGSRVPQAATSRTRPPDGW